MKIKKWKINSEIKFWRKYKSLAFNKTNARLLFFPDSRLTTCHCLNGNEIIVNFSNCNEIERFQSKKFRSSHWSLWHRCLPVNFAKFLRTPFFTEQLWWLLLKISEDKFDQYVKFEERFTNAMKQCNGALSILKTIKTFTPYKLRKQLAELLVLSRLDYGNPYFVMYHNIE